MCAVRIQVNSTKLNMNSVWNQLVVVKYTGWNGVYVSV